MKRSMYIPFAKAMKNLAYRELCKADYHFALYRIINPYREPSFSNLEKLGEFNSIYRLEGISRNEISRLYVVNM